MTEMNPNRADMSNCNPKAACADGLIYDPTNACPSGLTFNPQTCKCEGSKCFAVGIRWMYEGADGIDYQNGGCRACNSPMPESGLVTQCGNTNGYIAAYQITNINNYGKCFLDCGYWVFGSTVLLQYENCAGNLTESYCTKVFGSVKPFYAIPYGIVLIDTETGQDYNHWKFDLRDHPELWGG